MDQTVSEHLTITQSVTVQLVRHHDNLLSKAEELYAAGEYALAVIVAHTASEVATDRWLTAAMRSQLRPPLSEAVLDLIWNCNINNKNILRLYEGLTGTKLPADIVDRFRAFADVRNHTVHTGHPPNEAQAKAAVTIARDVVKHLDASVALSV
jgi:HEPN domain-containing protein